MRTLALLLLLPFSANADDAIDRIANEALKAWQVPGVAVAIVQDGKPLVAAFGVRRANVPLSPDDLFPLASCTKAVTATAIASLVDTGRISWDDPVSRLLDSFHLENPKADALVTLRDLLSHRTGVNGHDLLWYRSTLTDTEIVNRISKLPQTGTFRGSYQYSTLMYLAAGQAAAKAGGQPWHDLVRTRLTAPLGMSSVRFTTSDADFAKLPKAEGHRRLGELMPRYEMPQPNPAGSIYLNIRDMVPWLEMNLNGGEYKSRRIVSAENMNVIHTPQIPIPIDASMKRFLPDTVQLSYGLGWIISDYRGLKVLAHGGMIDGFRTQVILVPERKLGIALFNNLHDNKMNQALGNALVDHCLGLPARDWNALFLKAVAEEKAERDAAWMKLVEERKNLRPASIAPASFAGDYEHPAYGTISITWKENQLHWKWSTFESPMEYWGDDAFRITDGFLKDHIIPFGILNGQANALKFSSLIFSRK